MVKQDKPKSIPYRCPLCLTEKGCGFYGILVFEGMTPPICTHHEQPIQMEPSRGRPKG